MKGGLFYKAGSKSWSRPGRQVEAGVGVVSDIRGFISSWAGTQVAASVFSGVARGGIGGNADHGGGTQPSAAAGRFIEAAGGFALLENRRRDGGWNAIVEDPARRGCRHGAWRACRTHRT